MRFITPTLRSTLLPWLSLGLLLATGNSWAARLVATPAPIDCAASASNPGAVGSSPAPASAARRIPGSQLAAGQRDIAWAWLGSPTSRYAHAALGSDVHAASLHVRLAAGEGALDLVYRLPDHRVFEDRVLRLVDLDGDGRDEIVLVEADIKTGAALVVLGVRSNPEPALVELARGPQLGTAMRWLNPAGFADFDGDGRLDVASVTTPHIGGVLTLHHFRPPLLQPYATLANVSNHRYGELEQQMTVTVTPPGQRAWLVVPDQSQTRLRALRLEATGQWTEAAPLALAGRLTRLSNPGTAGGGVACARLADGTSLRVVLEP